MLSFGFRSSFLHRCILFNQNAVIQSQQAPMARNDSYLSVWKSVAYTLLTRERFGYGKRVLANDVTAARSESGRKKLLREPTARDGRARSTVWCWSWSRLQQGKRATSAFVRQICASGCHRAKSINSAAGIVGLDPGRKAERGVKVWPYARILSMPAYHWIARRLPRSPSAVRSDCQFIIDDTAQQNQEKHNTELSQQLGRTPALEIATHLKLTPQKASVALSDVRLPTVLGISKILGGISFRKTHYNNTWRFCYAVFPLNELKVNGRADTPATGGVGHCALDCWLQSSHFRWRKSANVSIRSRMGTTDWTFRHQKTTSTSCATGLSLIVMSKIKLIPITSLLKAYCSIV